LLTHPHMTPLGAIRANAPGLACELGWSEKVFRKAFGEVLALGIAKEDAKAPLVWFPNFLRHNMPESPNVVRSWVGAFRDLPESPLKGAMLERTGEAVRTLGEGSSAFAERSPVCWAGPRPAFRQPSRNLAGAPPALPIPFGEAFSEGMPNRNRSRNSGGRGRGTRVGGAIRWGPGLSVWRRGLGGASLRRKRFAGRKPADGAPRALPGVSIGRTPTGSVAAGCPCPGYAPALRYIGGDYAGTGPASGPPGFWGGGAAFGHLGPYTGPALAFCGGVPGAVSALRGGLCGGAAVRMGNRLPGKPLFRRGRAGLGAGSGPGGPVSGAAGASVPVPAGGGCGSRGMEAAR
ncbi:MAG: hypothetical protein ACLR0N_18400, partial [Bilophila wadsworthia]